MCENKYLIMCAYTFYILIKLYFILSKLYIVYIFPYIYFADEELETASLYFFKRTFLYST